MLCKYSLFQLQQFSAVFFCSIFKGFIHTEVTRFIYCHIDPIVYCIRTIGGGKLKCLMFIRTSCIQVMFLSIKRKKRKKLKDYVFIKIFSSVLVFFELKLVNSVELDFLYNSLGQGNLEEIFYSFWVHG